jgi:pimeloyl-[acyl-carrier protein] methyl ester esterase
MSAPPAPNEIVFLPGFDGAGELREPFVRALDARHPARALGYPNRPLETLDGYARFAASQLAPASRAVVVAESFSGLVAARWAAQDPRIAALVLCGAFARSPVAWAAIGASMPGVARFIGASFLSPMAFALRDAARMRWSGALAAALRSMRRDVIAERLRIIATDDVSRDLAGLRIPIAIAHFDDDLVIGAAARGRLESACRNPGIVRVPGPHFAIETRPRESAAALLPTLAVFFAAPASNTETR